MYQSQINPDCDERIYDVCIYCANYEYYDLIKEYCHKIMDEHAAEYPNDKPLEWHKWRYEAIEMIIENESCIRISCHSCKRYTNNF